MPRKTYPISKGRMAYAFYMRHTRQHIYNANRVARREALALDERNADRIERRENQIGVIKRRIKKIEEKPSKLGVAKLKECARNKNLPGELRAWAGEILLNIAIGVVDNEQPIKRRSRRRNQSLSP